MLLVYLIGYLLNVAEHPQRILSFPLWGLVLATFEFSTMSLHQLLDEWRRGE
ncbi:MAG TPA: hypothetical protein VFD70_02380 [Anaerolineae bacterium]|nr:hypothetical protein [Anaerolineae bacterium]